MITAKEARKQALIKSYELLTNEQKDVINNWMGIIRESVNNGAIGIRFDYNLDRLYSDEEFRCTIVKYMVLSGYNISISKKDKIIVEISWIDRSTVEGIYELKTSFK